MRLAASTLSSAPARGRDEGHLVRPRLQYPHPLVPCLILLWPPRGPGYSTYNAAVLRDGPDSTSERRLRLPAASMILYRTCIAMMRGC